MFGLIMNKYRSTKNKRATSGHNKKAIQIENKLIQP